MLPDEAPGDNRHKDKLGVDGWIKRMSNKKFSGRTKQQIKWEKSRAVGNKNKPHEEGMVGGILITVIRLLQQTSFAFNS